MRIQHNIMAMSAYRNYTNNVSAMKKNLEKLSSGYKINRAGDDAAGLAISEKMRAQITGLETAQKNAKDGISLVQTAEGALTEVHDMLNRMVELATQSANGTYDNDTDRYQLQKEMDQLRAEIDRIADSSNFNGIMLLDGSMDAGGDIKYTAGSFQFADAHPAGIAEGNYTLPKVGKTLGTDTVLHTNGTKGGDTNAFSIDLENVELLAGKAMDINIGDGVTITVTAGATANATAKDIISAIAGEVAGNNTTGITVTFAGAEKGTATDDATKNVLKIGGAEFELKASGTRLTFTQVNEADYELPKEVTLADSDPEDLKVSGSVGVEYTDGDGNDAGTLVFDLSGLTISGKGDLTVDFGNGHKYTITIDDDCYDSEGELNLKEVADRLAAKMTDIDDPSNANNKYATPNVAADGTTITFTNNANTATSNTDWDEIEGTAAKAAVYEYDTDNAKDITCEKTVTTSTFKWNEAAVNSGGTNLKSLITGTENITIGDDTITIDLDDVQGGLNGLTTDDIKESLIQVIKDAIEAANAKHEQDGDEEYTYIDATNLDVTLAADGFTLTGLKSYTAKVSEDSSSAKNFSGDYNKSTTVLQKKSDGVQDRLASTYFDLSKLAVDGKIAEGTTITIGRDTYTFTYDTNKIGKDGYVVLDGGEQPSTLQDAAFRLSKAAENNGTYTVGWDDKYNNGANLKEGRITLTEKDGQTNFDLTTMEGIEKSLGFKIASTNPTDSSKGLTLQIGDTAESYNQLKVNIKDCHTKALGLDLISISNQADAADAVNAIKSAINYVSDVRGTLGATQNRLDHTINNLSVMTENIQDAESTVRDVDIAEEMMAYTKNNILIQSAQAMLAQANQVPQGVLQLLQ